MKKFSLLFYWLAFFLFFSCTKDTAVEPPPDVPVPSENQVTGTTITMDSLRSLALKLPSEFSTQPQTRSTGKTIKEVVSLSSFFNQPATRTASAPDKNPVSDIYVVNYSGDAGFAIISADTRLVDVLAYSDEGNITDTLDNPGVKLFMHGVYDYADYMLNYLPEKGDSVAVHGQVRPAQAQMKSARTFTPPDYDDGYYYYEEVTDEESGWIGYVKEPLVQVRWGQNSPFNNYADICTATGSPAPAGCVATSIAQIISYHEWPPVIYPTAILNWDVLVSRKYWYQFADTNEIHMVASLFKEIGRLVNMDYGCNGSGAYDADANGAFNSELAYKTDGLVGYSPKQARIDLGKNRPVYVSGVRKDNNGAHAWVVDGYKDQRYTVHQISRWYRYLGGDSPHELVATDTLSSNIYTKDYVHCNWGWNGDNNGWFYDKIFTPNVDLIFRTDYPAETEDGKDFDDYSFIARQYSIDVRMIKNIRKNYES